MANRSGSAHHFTASEQLALQFVLTYLANPRGTRKSHWEQPIWCNFTWFTEIVATPVQTIKVRNSEHGKYRVVKRVVIFKLATDEVARITMRGEQYLATPEFPNPSIMWAVSRVRYLMRWGTGHDDGAWVDQPLLYGSLTGLPPATAPIG